MEAEKIELHFLKHLILQVNYNKLCFNFSLDTRSESELQKHHFLTQLYTWLLLKLA